MRVIKFSALLASGIMMLVATPVRAVSISLNAIADATYVVADGQNRNDAIIGAFNGAERLSIYRFDPTNLGAVVGGFTDSSAYQLDSINLVVTEDVSRDGNNGSNTLDLVAYLLDTDQDSARNSGWTVANVDDSTFVWHGNTAARSGDFGGVAAAGDNNVDPRSTSDTLQAAGSGGTLDGTSIQNFTFSTGSTDVATIDLFGAGGTAGGLQSVLASWVDGNNAGLGLRGFGTGTATAFGSQIFFQSLSTDGGGGENPGANVRIDLEFTAIPEPASLALLGMAMVGVVMQRRRS